MNKRNIFFKASYVCFFIFGVSIALFLADKIKIIFVLCNFELFLILFTISCYLMLKDFKDDFVDIYKIRYVFLLIIDFTVLLIIIGVIFK